MKSPTQRLAEIGCRRAANEAVGITSICSAHPVVIEAALRHGQRRSADVLIEATCNQVNQDGGYTGMTPGDFRAFVESIARDVGFDPSRLILGGDHLGPNPWKHLPVEDALDKASGGKYEKAKEPWAPHVVTSGLKTKKLLTGQNPASARPFAEELLKFIESS